MDKYFSTHDVAKMCQVTRGSVIRWIHEGKLPAALTAGGHHRIQVQDLYRLLKSLKMTIPPELEEQVKKEKPICILIVDDDSNVRKMLGDFLQQRFSFYIQEAADGFEAGLLVRHLKPEIILLDLMLPGVDGFRVCEQIRSQRELDHTRIIAITGMQDAKVRENILSLGADDFLAKPFDLILLAEKIKQQLEKNTLDFSQSRSQGGVALS